MLKLLTALMIWSKVTSHNILDIKNHNRNVKLMYTGIINV